jgi:hypothetical protein
MGQGNPAHYAKGETVKGVRRKPLTASELREPLLKLYQQHHASGTLPTSARFLFYELESQGFISKETAERTDGKKGRRPDQNMLDALTNLRESGEIAWEDIVDETRSLEDYSGESISIRDWTKDVLEQYCIDPWRGGGPVILCESRSLAGVLRPIASTYRAPIASTNGQANGFLRNNVAPILAERTCLYFGDWDFSGAHIEQNTRRILGAVDWERLAITEAQVREFRLTRIQKYDKRDKQNHEAVETEALRQETITNILRQRLEDLLPEPLRNVQEREKGIRRRFGKQLERLR